MTQRSNFCDRSEVIKDNNDDETDSDIESEKLLESLTEKESKDKDVDTTPVVVRRRHRKTSPASTSTLPQGRLKRR